MNRTVVGLSLACLLFLSPTWAVAEDAAAKVEAPAPAAPRRYSSEHRLVVGKGELRYTARAEDVYLKDAAGKPTATFFTLSYVLAGVARPEDRPVTFVFNGGPGSSSIWLHLGLVGPKRVDLPSDASDPGAPPYRLRDNPWTILRATDLVFVDPVGTGFSKALGEKKNADFWGFDEDADSVAELIRTWITQQNRWASPKYLLGESYGGIRSALLVPRLQQGLSLNLNGVILISPALNMAILPFLTAGNDLPHATQLPAYAAVAYHHKRLPGAWPSLEALLQEAEAFAGSEYLAALFRGDALPAAERERIAQKLHRFTGLPTGYLLASDLRIQAVRFIKELLRDEGKVLGILDGRYAQEELDRVGELPGADPFSTKTSPAYVATFQSYLRNQLKVDLDERYLESSDEANQSWKRPAPANHAFAGFIDVTGQLAQGTKDNEGLRIFAASGYHDLTTTYFATRYMLRHSGIDDDQLVLKDYPGGHMMYLHQPSLEALSEDLVRFLEGR
jgi:carboxypeptidase C (cathepsin A)